ncbi:MAG: phage tail sheath family protein [Bacteroidia bacterium]
MNKDFMTPGVFIEEKNAFTTSIVAVPTAVPAFIGHTERAARGTEPLAMKPTRIASFAEFESFFGGAPKTTYELTAGTGAEPYKLQNPETQFYLYNSMKLFYTNGGGTCWIVSIGSYTDPLDAAKFNEGLQTLMKIEEPTMLVSPDASLLRDRDCFDFQENMINQGGDMRDRIAILDIHGGNLEDGKGGFKDRVEASDIVANGALFSEIKDADGNPEESMIERFRNAVGLQHPDFGAAYYPWLHSTTTTANDVGFANIRNLDQLKTLIDNEAEEQNRAGLIKQEKLIQILAESTTLVNVTAEAQTAEKALLAVSPIFKDILKDIRAKINVLPPSGAIAGIISSVDNEMGVAHSPANVGLSSVTAPTILISNEGQEDLNVPLNGKAVNALRAFPGKGVLVWGARTLDGNSQDWRYIAVRRSVIMIEQSIKIALGAYTFAPNVQNTWMDVKSAITSFLTAQWSNGVLAGAAPTDAFDVSVGLGTTMTSNDVLNGMMLVSVKLAVTRPAEFIVLTFQQQMQVS